MATIRVLLADDHAVLREGLRVLLEMRGDVEVVGEVADGRAAIDAVQRHAPDVVVMDISMPGLDGLAATRQIKMEYPNVRVLILSQHDDPRYVLPVLKAGAAGYVLKRSAAEELLTAIQTVHGGDSYLPPAIAKEVLNDYRQVRDDAKEPDLDELTPREREVLTLVAEGYTSQEIADLLCVSPRTVMVHRANIYKKLGTHNRAELIKYAIRKGLIDLES